MFLPREMPFYFLFHWGDVHLFAFSPSSSIINRQSPIINPNT